MPLQPLLLLQVLSMMAMVPPVAVTVLRHMVLQQQMLWTVQGI